jgi:hypothetical protein
MFIRYSLCQILVCAMEKNVRKIKTKKKTGPVENPAPSPHDSVTLKGKRKKRRPDCPNPLFIQWLEEWKAAARAKDNQNLSFVYSKALKSLKKFPTVLESGQACAVLENIGPKTCKLLDDRLAEHR